MERDDFMGVARGHDLTVGVRPTPQPAPSDYVDYQTKTALRLLFDDEFTVYWGVRHPHQNYHVVYPNQRFAYDWSSPAMHAPTPVTARGTRTTTAGRPILLPPRA